MKTFKCTIEAQNECYVETLIVVEDDIEKAEDRVKKYASPRRVIYTRTLERVNIGTRRKVIRVGFGANDRIDHGSDGDL